MLRIKELREARGEMQKVIAKALGIAPSTYSQYETGKREPDYSTLSKIADYFNVSVDYLLGKTDIKKAPAHGEQGRDEFEPSDGDIQDELIGFYGEIKKDLTDDDISDIKQLMRIRAELNRSNKE